MVQNIEHDIFLKKLGSIFKMNVKEMRLYTTKN